MPKRPFKVYAIHAYPTGPRLEERHLSSTYASLDRAKDAAREVLANRSTWGIGRSGRHYDAAEVWRDDQRIFRTGAP